MAPTIAAPIGGCPPAVAAAAQPPAVSTAPNRRGGTTGSSARRPPWYIASAARLLQVAAPAVQKQARAPAAHARRLPSAAKAAPAIAISRGNGRTKRANALATAREANQR